jgi:hypothetical protein
MPLNERELTLLIQEKTDELNALIETREARRLNKSITCACCGKKTKLKNLTLLQTHWYEGPYGCTGGDRWHQGEKQYECPKCGQVNRGLDEKWPRCNPSIEKLARYFGNRENVYK